MIKLRRLSSPAVSYNDSVSFSGADFYDAPSIPFSAAVRLFSFSIFEVNIQCLILVSLFLLSFYDTIPHQILWNLPGTLY